MTVMLDIYICSYTFFATHVKSRRIRWAGQVAHVGEGRGYRET